jgi:protein tyrosine kinase modulator
MQPTEAFSIPRRALDVEDYIDILRRHKGWVFGPFLLTLVIAVVGAYLWPDSYQSTAVIKIVPQQVPEKLVQSTVNQDVSGRLASMSADIRSNTTLTTIITNFDLYKRERNRMPMQDVVELMNKNISIQQIGQAPGAREFPAFSVQFTYENRLLAKRVVDDLVNRFLSANKQTRSTATWQTTEFLKNQVDQAKKELDAAEQQLTQFRVQYSGRLPDQADANMRQLQNLQAQANYLDNAIRAANEDKLQREANIRIYKQNIDDLNREPVTVAAQTKSQRLTDADREVQTLETNLAALRTKYKDTWPDVISTQSLLDGAKKRRDEIRKEDDDAREAAKKAAEKEETKPTLSLQVQREIRELNDNISRLNSDIHVRDLEVENYNKQRKQTQEAIDKYNTLLQSVPISDQQYGDYVRERDLSKQKYMELDKQLDAAQIAQDMEDKGHGESLELLDPANTPINPVEPRREIIIPIGAGLGLLLGVAIAGAREMKDTSLKNLKDVRAYTQMAILGSIPLLENDFVVRRRKRLAWLGWTTACLLAAVTMGGSIVYYYFITRAA